MKEKIINLKNNAEALVKSVTDVKTLEDLKVRFLGKKVN